MALSNNEILNLTDYYLNEYNLDKKNIFKIQKKYLKIVAISLFMFFIIYHSFKTF